MLDLAYMTTTVYFWLLIVGLGMLAFGWLFWKGTRSVRLIGIILLLAAVGVIFYCLYFLWQYILIVGV